MTEIINELEIKERKFFEITDRIAEGLKKEGLTEEKIIILITKDFL